MSGRVPGQLPLLDDQEVAEAHGWPPSPVTEIRTSGRTEYAVQCAKCGALHRHIFPGIRRGACGALYAVPAAEEGPESPGPQGGDT